MRGVISAKINMITEQIIEKIIYKAKTDRDTTGASRRPLGSTVKWRNGIERKVNEY